MPLDNSIFSTLLVGTWKQVTGNNTKFYEFLVDRDIVIYSDYNFPKAEPAKFKLKVVKGTQQLTIKHTIHPLPTEIYTIVELDHKKMIWSYLDGEEEKTINLFRFSDYD